ncbi:MAG: phospholipase D-like domain-containing protein [Planctomycetota bacterium]
MNTATFDDLLCRTLDDGRLSRAEGDALRAVLDEHELDAHTSALLRSRVFAAAAERLVDPRDRKLLDWCEELCKVIDRPDAPTAAAKRTALAAFSPGEDCRRAILEHIDRARRSLDACVFTITDNRNSDALEAAHRRGVAVRVISDNDKAHDLGSDIERLARAGVPTAVDRTPHHMHHKFAVADGRLLLTGSYNWTRSAAKDNEENVVVTDDPPLVRAFDRHFGSLWKRLAARG